MKEELEALSEQNEWGFVYARRDYQNLFDEEPIKDKITMFLDPINTIDSFGEYGQITSTSCNVNFMLLMSSSLDEIDYNYRFETYIKPILNTAKEHIITYLRCNTKIELKSLKSTEIINAFDYNMDGVVFTLNAIEYV